MLQIMYSVCIVFCMNTFMLFFFYLNVIFEKNICVFYIMQYASNRTLYKRVFIKDRKYLDTQIFKII